MVRPGEAIPALGSGAIVLNEAGWKARLQAAVKAGGHSMRAISLEAGLSQHYLHSILEDGREPTVAGVIAIAEVLGVSPGELIDGRRVSPETQRLMDLWDSLPRERRRALLQFLSA
jgi:lambda repressor-like predicted transcriptional regulator